VHGQGAADPDLEREDLIAGVGAPHYAVVTQQVHGGAQQVRENHETAAERAGQDALEDHQAEEQAHIQYQREDMSGMRTGVSRAKQFQLVMSHPHSK
jgi:hypothetical protein